MTMIFYLFLNNYLSYYFFKLYFSDIFYYSFFYFFLVFIFFILVLLHLFKKIKICAMAHRRHSNIYKEYKTYYMAH